MTLQRQAKDTLTAVELNHGDTLRFTLRNGQTRTLLLEQTAAKVLVTNLKELKKARGGGGTLLHFTARVRVDGQPMTMERYVGSQESFYEPYVVNGMRVWFDAVADLFDFVTEKHGECKPAKQARFAVQDATLPICPQEIQPWYPNDKQFIAIRDCYSGDDCWLGAYQGADAHGGLDVNMRKGTPHWAPIDFDDQWYFNSLAAGHNNNRWRATRKWPDGSTWTLQSHHLLKLLVPEHTPLKAGTHYAEAAGVHVGSHEHSHFVFKVTEGDESILLDPWIVFWQIFENQKRKAGALRAAMAPLAPARTGQAVPFRRIGAEGRSFWTFGDGASSPEDNPAHTFLTPGLYPVTLTVDNGKERAAFTQHITVDGEAVAAPAPARVAPDEPRFRPRPVHAMDVYGWPVPPIPLTGKRPAQATRPRPQPTRDVTLTTRDPGFWCTPYFWVCPGYHTWPKGHSGLVLTNGARAAAGEFARFTPDLAAGRYEVSLSPKTAFDKGAAFLVRVRHAQGDGTVRVEPARSRVVGTFAFDEGADGFVEILAKDSVGQVLVDAVAFKRIN
ncbi:MAG TPA: PKD domain-containing protein [Planctomycetota bacterium]|nr:PKD domain-containing protein [Planctomycetota bacterium]